MLGFQYFNNDLLVLIKTYITGVEVFKIILTCPTYADDMGILLSSKKAVQLVLNIIRMYASLWRMRYNSTKCTIIVFGKDSCPNMDICLGDQIIKVKAADKHLGTLLTDNSKEIDLFIAHRIKECHKPGYAINAMGSRQVPVPINCANKAYWSICVPKLTYGLEIMTLSTSNIQKCESFHAEIAKSIQGLPSQTANYGAVCTMGWMSIQSVIDIKRMTFLWHLLCLPLRTIFKKLLIRRYTSITYCDTVAPQGPLYKMLQTCRKYNLLNTVCNALESGIYMSKREWKKIITEKVWQHENHRWKFISMLFSNLRGLRAGIKEVKMWSWWRYASSDPKHGKDIRTILKMLLNVHQLNSVTAHHEHNSTPRCQFCDTGAVESVAHMLFACSDPETCVSRNRLWAVVKENGPNNLITEIELLSIEERTIFLLTGLNNTYTPEWSAWLDNVKSFLVQMYIKRVVAKA